MELFHTLNGEEFVELEFLEDIAHNQHNLSFSDGGSIETVPLTVENAEAVSCSESRACEHGLIQTSSKAKRQGNLTEFGDDVPNKRKNESAKRELTSVVNQLGKIDKQLNSEADKSRVAINFVATFTSFKSNRINTFKYPLDAEVKKTFLDHDVTIAAVKNAVAEAVGSLADQLKSKAPEKQLSTIDLSSATDDQLTPTKTIAAFTALPSPIAIKGQPVSSMNLCVKNSCTFGKKIRKHVWIKCCHQTDGQSCTYWVHASCIGFPTLKQENVQMLDGWFCPEHTHVQMKRK